MCDAGGGTERHCCYAGLLVLVLVLLEAPVFYQHVLFALVFIERL